MHKIFFTLFALSSGFWLSCMDHKSDGHQVELIAPSVNPNKIVEQAAVAPVAINIDIKEEAAAPTAQQAESIPAFSEQTEDRPWEPTPILTSINTQRLSEQSRYLDCTRLPLDVHRIIAGYLSNEWVAAENINNDGDFKRDISFAPDGSHFLTTCIGGVILKYWDIKKSYPQELLHLRSIAPKYRELTSQDSQDFTFIQHSPDGKYIAAIGDKGNDHYVNYNQFEYKGLINILIKHDDGCALSKIVPWGPYMPKSAVFSRNNKLLAVVDANDTITIYDLSIDQAIFQCMPTSLPAAGNAGHITSVEFHPDCKQIAYTWGNMVALLPFDKTKKLRSIRLDNLPGVTPDFWCFAATFTPDGSKLVIGCEQFLILWDLHNKTYKIHKADDKVLFAPGFIKHITCTNSNIIFAIDDYIYSLDHSFENFDKRQETVIHAGEGDKYKQHYINKLALAQNNSMLLALTDNNLVRVWKNKADLLSKPIEKDALINNPAEKNLNCRESCNEWFEQTPCRRRTSIAIKIILISCLVTWAAVSMIFTPIYWANNGGLPSCGARDPYRH